MRMKATSHKAGRALVVIALISFRPMVTDRPLWKCVAGISTPFPISEKSQHVT